MQDTIKTTGELRKFLCESIISVRDGAMNTEIAGRITKMAAQVNESFYSEIKIHTTMKEAGGQVFELGVLPISADKPI